MPEGPEVETVRRTLAPQLVGQRVESAWVSPFSLRTKVSKASFKCLLGITIVDVKRHGKLMWFEGAGEVGAMIRLGMTGRVLVDDVEESRAKHTHVGLRLSNGRELRYIDARRFGDVRPFANAAILDAALANLGPDPISFDVTGRNQVVDALGKTGRKIKDAVLDQKLVAGVGNIYACEALFVAGVDPRRRGNEISKKRRVKVVDALEEMLCRAVKNGGTTLRDYVDADGKRGSHQDHLHVFQRVGQPCGVCGRAITRDVWGGRSTFSCRRCQR